MIISFPRLATSFIATLLFDVNTTGIQEDFSSSQNLSGIRAILVSPDAGPPYYLAHTPVGKLGVRRCWKVSHWQICFLIWSWEILTTWGNFLVELDPRTNFLSCDSQWDMVTSRNLENERKQVTERKTGERSTAEAINDVYFFIFIIYRCWILLYLYN